MFKPQDPNAFDPRSCKPHEWRNRTQKGLRIIANMVRTPRFIAWLDETGSRFAWATPDVFMELLDRYSRQLCRNPLLKETEPSMAEVLERFAGRCEAMAQAIIEHDGLNPNDDDVQFAFPAGADASQVISDTINSEVWGNTYQYEGTTGLTCTFVSSGITGLKTYVASRLTLEQHTGHAGFETVLSRVTTRYLLAGDAHSLLADCGQMARDTKEEALLWLGMETCNARWGSYSPWSKRHPYFENYILLHLHPTTGDAFRIKQEKPPSKWSGKRWGKSKGRMMTGKTYSTC